MSRYLVDTCAVIWWLADAPELSGAARRAISSRRNSILVSVASQWEIAIRTRQARLAGTEEYLARYDELHDEWGFSTVLIEAAGAVTAGRLTIPHSDPFDRMLIVQARRLEASILTCDEGIRQYADRSLWQARRLGAAVSGVTRIDSVGLIRPRDAQVSGASPVLSKAQRHPGADRHGNATHPGGIRDRRTQGSTNTGTGCDPASPAALAASCTGTGQRTDRPVAAISRCRVGQETCCTRLPCDASRFWFWA